MFKYQTLTKEKVNLKKPFKVFESPRLLGVGHWAGAHEFLKCDVSRLSTQSWFPHYTDEDFYKSKVLSGRELNLCGGCLTKQLRPVFDQFSKTGSITHRGGWKTPPHS